MSSMCTPMSISGPPPGRRHPGEPAAEPGDPLAPQPARLGVVDVAEQPGVDDLLQRLHVAAAAVVERDVEYAVVAAGRLHHGSADLAVLGHRLLRQDVQAGVQRGDRDRRVQRGRAWRCSPRPARRARRGPASRRSGARGRRRTRRRAAASWSASMPARATRSTPASCVVRGHVLATGPAQADDARARAAGSGCPRRSSRHPLTGQLALGERSRLS